MARQFTERANRKLDSGSVRRFNSLTRRSTSLALWPVVEAHFYLCLRVQDRARVITVTQLSVVI